MPIQVQGPDGQIIEFPDGTPDAVMEGALREFYGSPKGPDFSNVQSSASTVAADGWKPGLARDVAMGARSTLQGVGSTLGLVTDPLARGADWIANKVAPPAPSMSDLITGSQPQPRRIFGTAREGFSALADTLGLPKPQTSRERVIGDVGEALAGTGVTMGVGGLLRNTGPIADKVGKFLTAQPGLQAVSAASGATASGSVREAGGGPLEQLGAGLLAGVLPGTVSSLAAAGTRGLVRGRSGEQMRRTINDFAALGATPSVGQASGNRLIQGAENVLGGAPTSAGVMSRFVERQADDIGAGLGRQAENLSRRASAEKAGRAIESGVAAFAKSTKAKRAALYAAADAAIPDTVQSPLTNTRQALTELTALTPGAESTSAGLVNPRIQQLAQSVGEDMMAAQASGQQGIPYAALKDLRSRIGEEISDFALDPSRPSAQYRRLYAALSRDMEEAARAQGPDAMRAAKRANDYMRVSANRLEDIERVVDKAGGPEKVFLAAMSGTKDGGTTLRKVMQSLDKEGQRAVTSAVIKRMGMPTPGQAGIGADEFSAATFLTNWNRVSPEARRALFDRHGLGFSRDMDRIARVADNIKTGAKVFANPSGTANLAAAQGYAIGLPLSFAQAPFTGHWWPVAAMVGGGVGANMSARALTNPRVVRWLAQSTSMPVGSVQTSLREMAAQARRAGDDEAAAFAESLSEQQPESAPHQRTNGNESQ